MHDLILAGRSAINDLATHERGRRFAAQSAANEAALAQGLPLPPAQSSIQVDEDIRAMIDVTRESVSKLEGALLVPAKETASEFVELVRREASRREKVEREECIKFGLNFTPSPVLRMLNGIADKHLSRLEKNDHGGDGTCLLPGIFQP